MIKNAWSYVVFVLLCALGPLKIEMGLDVPLTLQTFFLCLLFLVEPKKSWVFILVYIFLGAIGLPIFSGYEGGMGKLLGPSLGFFVGFLLASLSAFWMRNWDSFCSWNSFYKALIWHGMIVFSGLVGLWILGKDPSELQKLFFKLTPGVILKSLGATIVFITGVRLAFSREINKTD